MKAIGLVAVVTWLLLTGHCIAQEQPIYQPSKDDPRIVAALDAQIRLGEVMAKRDISGIEALMAPDLVVYAPINRVTDRPTFWRDFGRPKSVTKRVNEK